VGLAAAMSGVALVTGGNRGIGRAIALRLAEAGFAVCVSGRDEDALAESVDELEGRGARALGVPGDVSSEEDVAQLVERASGLGPLEAVVNNAGAAGPTLPLHELPAEEFASVIAANLLGPFLVAKHALPGMIERRSGSIVNIGSVAGVQAYPLRSPYAASKWGLVGLTRTLAAEVGRHGIRVNLVAPGPTRGGRSDAVIRARAEASGVAEAEVRRTFEEQIPLRRFVEPSEVAAAVAFLCSEAASGITGQSFCVSGGFEL
jgi:meso-butanediol dehydrogenase/(S,S)-butanediol dehydrogenase/diacetyl reductase